MGLHGNVTAQVNKAFKSVGDLAVNVQLIQRTVEGYDFTTSDNLPKPTPTINKTIKGIIVNNTRTGRISGSAKPVNSHALHKQLLLKATDISDISDYDDIVINGNVWHLIPPYENDGFLMTVNIVKEA
jgi:hypothetical protein